MTQTSNIASKLFVGFVATAMLFTLSFSSANAATMSATELEKTIEALTAQIAALKGGSSSAGSASCTTFTVDQTMGSKGAETMPLQNFLIGKGHAIAAGATGFFGGQTKAALASFQAANGITPAIGYFGPKTRAAVNAMCTTTGGGTTGGGTTDGGTTDGSSSDELSGEASLNDVSAKSGDDTDIEEGAEDAPVADFEVEFQDGDAKITRIDLGLVAVTASEEKPWKTFDEVSVWVDGDEVARVDASNKSDYLDEDLGTLRISGLDIVAMDDEKTTITIGVSTQNSIDNVPATWRVDMEAMRFMDGDDVSTTEDATGDIGTGDGVTFDIDVEGGDDEVIVKSSSSDPDSTTIAVETNKKSDWVNVFSFDLDTDDSTNDIEITDLVAHVSIGSTSAIAYNTVVNDARLMVDGNEIGDVTVTTGTTNSGTLTFDFDDEEFMIDAGDKATVELELEFNALATGNEGITVSASTSNTGLQATGADDLASGQISGSAEGDTHTLRTQGAVLKFVSSTQSIKANTDATTADDEGVFVVKFDVTAFESDLWINKTASNTASMGAFGVNFQVENASGAYTNIAQAISSSLSSSASTDGTRFKVNEGETKSFTLTVNYNPETAGFYQVQLYSVNFAASNADPVTQQRALPESDYESDQLSI